MKRGIFLAFLFMTLSASHSSAAETPAQWRLVWSDEFDGQSLDSSKWRAEDAALIKNSELQYYTPDDVYLENGNLVLRSQKRDMYGRHYSSGLVETKGKFSKEYGRFETRAKLPKGKGIWPAHWMLPVDKSWPPEIDIMELLGHDPKTVYAHFHWSVYSKHAYEGRRYTGPDFSADFHVFAVEWEPTEIRWYVDGDLVMSRKGQVPHKPFYLILNTAVGGVWPGNPDATTQFPQYHLIDYVRVYEKA